MVEGAALEMLYRGNPIEGSNPSLSVSKGNLKKALVVIQIFQRYSLELIFALVN